MKKNLRKETYLLGNVEQGRFQEQQAPSVGSCGLKHTSLDLKMKYFVEFQKTKHFSEKQVIKNQHKEGSKE